VTDGGSLVITTVSPTPDLSSDSMIAVTLAASDPASSQTTTDPTAPSGLTGVDPLGNPCVPDPTNQTNSATPAAVSVTDVLPGGGLLPAGSSVSIVGTGFQLGVQVLIDGVAPASMSWVDSSHLDVVIANDTQLDGKSVTVNNPDGTGATYVSYLRATDLGKSATPLLASAEAIFPVQTQASASFAAPTGGTFFGLALQNPAPDESNVSVDLVDAGSVVASASITLPPLTKISRDLSELFAGVVPSAESVVQVTATVPIQMLGLSGNTNDGSVTPVLPAPASP
jgi:hypothetical protein